MDTIKRRCKRCGNGWKQKLKEYLRPKQCPACKSPKWDQPLPDKFQGRKTKPSQAA